MLRLSRRDVVLTKDNKPAHGIGKPSIRLKACWNKAAGDYSFWKSSYPASFSILIFVPVSLSPSSITVLCSSDLSRRQRERQRREFTLFCKTRFSSVPNSLEKPTVQCTAMNLHCIGKKDGNHTSQVSQNECGLARPYTTVLAERCSATIPFRPMWRCGREGRRQEEEAQ